VFTQCDGVFGGGGGVWVPQQAAREVSPGFIHLFRIPILPCVSRALLLS